MLGGVVPRSRRERGPWHAYLPKGGGLPADNENAANSAQRFLAHLAKAGAGKRTRNRRVLEKGRVISPRCLSRPALMPQSANACQTRAHIER